MPVTYNVIQVSADGTCVVTASEISCPSSGADSEAFGNGACNGSHSRSFAAGKNAVNAGGNDAVAVGFDARTFGTGSVAIGSGSRASNAHAVAIGLGANVSYAEGVAIGYLATVNAIGAFAIGYSPRVNNTGGGNGIAFGDNVWIGDGTPAGARSIGVGGGMTVWNRNCIVVGWGSDTSHVSSVTNADYQCLIGVEADIPESTTTVVTDTFTDTDGVTLSSHPANTGQAWAANLGSLKISGGKLVLADPTATSVASIASTSGTPSSHVTAELSVTTPASGYFAAGILFRFTDSNNYWMLGFGKTNESTSFFRLYECVSGAFTQVGTDHTVATAYNTTTAFKVVDNGTDIACWVNGVQATNLNHSSTSQATSAKHGIRMYGDGSGNLNGASVDNFSVTYFQPAEKGGIKEVVIGRGPASAHAANVTVRPSDAAGDNVPGVDLILRGGFGTGSGEPGKVAIKSGIRLEKLSTDPTAPVTNNGVLFLRDDGTGKMQLAARFPTGAVQVVAVEP